MSPLWSKLMVRDARANIGGNSLWTSRVTAGTCKRGFGSTTIRLPFAIDLSSAFGHAAEDPHFGALAFGGTCSAISASNV
eukprot:CAMPEP_0115667770 /NCGR_PEP_ID=MMETSP0272-20121206/50118_1 /TAXON_ID=71861 /ORGANISM="Scrippsiella trochoidea, Strain CCMP3099" /LENGTH=79 /DNA_ID=CAMNT_0003106341 /DNA_START=225 /DNA_END=464 /DNA_ORIENTATION=+